MNNEHYQYLCTSRELLQNRDIISFLGKTSFCTPPPHKTTLKKKSLKFVKTTNHEQLNMTYIFVGRELLQKRDFVSCL